MSETEVSPFWLFPNSQGMIFHFTSLENAYSSQMKCSKKTFSDSNHLNPSQACDYHTVDVRKHQHYRGFSFERNCVLRRWESEH